MGRIHDTRQIVIGGTNQSNNVKIAGKAVPDPVGAYAAYIAKLSPLGVGLWGDGVAATGSSFTGGVSLLSNGDVIHAGTFAGTADLGAGTTVQSASGGTVVSLFVVRRAQ